MENKRDSFFVRGTPKEVAQKLAKLIDDSNPDNTGTGIEELDISKLDSVALAKIGLNVSGLSKAFTVNLFHRVGQQTGLHALVIGFRNKPDICEVIPRYLDGPINPDNMCKAGLVLVN